MIQSALNAVGLRPSARPAPVFVPDQRRDVIASDGVRLSATLAGPEHAPALLLVHGYPDDSRVWDPVCEVLRQDFRVIRYDVRGAGASRAPSQPQGYRLPQLANDVFSVIEACHPEGPVHLVGHDWGAIQAWEAATDPRAEQWLESLSVISGPCLDHVGAWIRDQWQARQLTGLARQLAKSWYIAAFHLPGLAPTLWRAGFDRAWPLLLAWQENVTREPTSDRRSDGVNGLQLYRANIRERLRQPGHRHCLIPVHILVPQRDRFVGADIMESARPWARELTMDFIDAGHWAPLSHPEKVAGWISRRVSREDGIGNGTHGD